MRIFIRNLHGSQPPLELEVHIETSVDQIKQIIYEQWGIPPADQKLLYSGKMTTGELKSLLDYGVHNGSNITLIDRDRHARRRQTDNNFGVSSSLASEKFRGIDKKRIGNYETYSFSRSASIIEVPVVLPDERIITVDVDQDGTVIELKGAIEEACELAGIYGIGSLSQRLWLAELVLRSRDSVRLRDLGVTKDSIVKLETLYTRPYIIMIGGSGLREELGVRVIHSDNIASVKTLLEKHTGIHPRRLDLSFGGRGLEDADVLADCCIDAGCQVQLEILPNLDDLNDRRKAEIEIALSYSGGAREIFTADRFATVSSLKQQVSHQRGVPETHMEIWNNDRLFDDYCTLDEYKIKSGKILEVRLAGVELIDVFLKAPNGSIIPGIIRPSTITIAELKSQLCHRGSSIPKGSSEFDIVVDDRVLDDASTLGSNEIGCTTKLVVRIKRDHILNDMALYDLTEETLPSAPERQSAESQEDEDSLMSDSAPQLQNLILSNIPSIGRTEDILAEQTKREAETHLLREHAATLLNGGWRNLLPLLSEPLRWDLKYDRLCWTCTPSGNLSNNEIPLTIAGAPVVVPVDYRYPLSAGIAPPRDPYSGIDPRAKITTTTIERAFGTFPEAYGFYFLINGMLQVLVPKGFDYEWAYSHRPNTFGGLEVSYIRRKLTPTSGRRSRWQSNVTSSSSGSSGSTRYRPRVISQGTSSNTSMSSTSINITLSSAIEARVHDPKGKSKAKEAHYGRIGVRTRVENGKNAGTYLVMSSHVITSSLLAQDRGPMQKIFAKSKAVQLKDNWHEDADIWIQDHRIGYVYKTFDPHAEIYPRGFKHDISLVRPSAKYSDDLKDIKSPVPQLGWISQTGWDCLRAEPSRLRILISSVDVETPEARTIKSNTPSDISAIGEGIFLNQHKLFGSKKDGQQRRGIPGQDQERQDWSTLVSRCILYRVSPDFQVPGGQSGLAIYGEGERSDNRFGPGVIGFKSFMQRSGHVQTYEMEERALAARLEKGLVAFYGAFQVPKEMRREHIIL